MFSFATDYYITVFIATLGVMQVAASLGRLRGLLIIKTPLLARMSGLALAIGAFAWFFASGTRNLNDYAGGIDANTQALFLFLGASTAIAVTLALSSLVNVGMKSSNPGTVDGLDALKSTSYVRALVHSLRYWCKIWCG